MSLFVSLKNASAFRFKRKCVSVQTQVRFSLNASTFDMKRKGVLL